jgi:hypothetical protein
VIICVCDLLIIAIYLFTSPVISTVFADDFEKLLFLVNISVYLIVIRFTLRLCSYISHQNEFCLLFNIVRF